MSIPGGVYFVYSLRTGRTGVFGSGFSVLEVKEDGNKLTIETFTGGRIELARQGASDIWVSGDFRIEATPRSIKSNDMMIGKAIYKPTSDKVVEGFAAIKLPPDLSPILIGDTNTDYNIFYQSPQQDGVLAVEKHGQGQLKFTFPHGGSHQAVTPGAQAPGRFNALRGSANGRPLYGFVLPHCIREGGHGYRVIVGHAGKPGEGAQGSVYVPDDIEPYVAVSVNPGPAPCDEG